MSPCERRPVQPTFSKQGEIAEDAILSFDSSHARHFCSRSIPPLAGTVAPSARPETEESPFLSVFPEPVRDVAAKRLLRTRLRRASASVQRSSIARLRAAAARPVLRSGEPVAAISPILRLRPQSVLQSNARPSAILRSVLRPILRLQHLHHRSQQPNSKSCSAVVPSPSFAAGRELPVRTVATTAVLSAAANVSAAAVRVSCASRQPLEFRQLTPMFQSRSAVPRDSACKNESDEAARSEANSAHGWKFGAGSPRPAIDSTLLLVQRGRYWNGERPPSIHRDNLRPCRYIPLHRFLHFFENVKADTAPF